MPTSALRLYRELFAKQIQENNPIFINNGSRAHASIIISELVKSADKKVFIQCSHFNDDVYDADMIVTLNDAVARGCEVKIAIRESSSNKILISNLDSKVAVLKTTDTFPQDFCVVDAKRFRLEIDAEAREAVACAFDENFGGKLDEIFKMAL